MGWQKRWCILLRRLLTKLTGPPLASFWLEVTRTALLWTRDWSSRVEEGRGPLCALSSLVLCAFPDCYTTREKLLSYHEFFWSSLYYRRVNNTLINLFPKGYYLTPSLLLQQTPFCSSKVVLALSFLGFAPTVPFLGIYFLSSPLTFDLKRQCNPQVLMKWHFLWEVLKDYLCHLTLWQGHLPRIPKAPGTSLVCTGPALLQSCVHFSPGLGGRDLSSSLVPTLLCMMSGTLQVLHASLLHPTQLKLSMTKTQLIISSPYPPTVLLPVIYVLVDGNSYSLDTPNRKRSVSLFSSPLPSLLNLTEHQVLFKMSLQCLLNNLGVGFLPSPLSSDWNYSSTGFPLALPKTVLPEPSTFSPFVTTLCGEPLKVAVYVFIFKRRPPPLLYLSTFTSFPILS